MNQRLLQQLGAIGQQAQLRADYEKTLTLLAGLKAGDVCLDEVELVAGGWRLVEVKPPGPAELVKLIEVQTPAPATPES